MWGTIAVLLVSAVLSVVLAPKTKRTRPEPATDFDTPKVEEGQAIPVLFGTKRIRGPNTLWYGDIRSQEIVEKGGKK